MSTEGWGQKTDEKWVEIQRKTFTRWVNTYLKERLLSCKDLSEDFKDGTLLINLLEVISSKALGKYNKKPGIKAQILENHVVSINFLKSEGLKLVNIGPEDLADGKIKLILGMIWTLILRYQINVEEGKSAKSELLQWVRSKIPEYNIVNFTNDWNDGKALCGLVNALVPGLCPNHRDLSPHNAYQNAEKGGDLAEREMGIPKVIDTADLINPSVDELSVMTYISYFRDWEGADGKRKRTEQLERTTVPERSRAYGPGYEAAETNNPTNFTIESINQFGRRVPCGGDKYNVTVTGPSGKNLDGISIADNNDGTYTVKYTPVEVGKTQIQVQLQGKHISNSPKIIPVSRDQPDPMQCLCYGPGLEKATVGEKAPFTIEARNKHGKALATGGDPFEVFVKGPFDADIPATLVDNKNGTYSVSYVPTDKGKHQVKVMLKGAHVAKSPYDVMAFPNPREPDAMKTVAYGPGIDPKGDNNTNEPSNFTVELRNHLGEKVKPPPGPLIIDCFVTDPRGNDIDDMKIKDNGDGTLNVQYHAKEAGPHLIEVVLRNPHKPHYYDHIQGSPFRVDIAPGTDPKECIAYGPGLEDGVEDTIPTHFTIEARDGRGNRIHKGGDPFVVKINGPTGVVPCTVKDNGDGTYRVDYKANDAGPHKIAVTLKDGHIKGSVFDVLVREGADERFTIIESYSFVIRAKTKKNTNKKTGGDNIKVNINGNRGAVKDIKLDDKKDGTYVATFSLPEAGSYQVNVLLNDKDIKSSPFNINAK